VRLWSCVRLCVGMDGGQVPLMRVLDSGVAAMDAAAKYWLACGMNQVVAVFSARDLSVRPYGIGDRYGAQLQNKVYLRRLSIDMAVDMPIARTKTAHASRTIMLSRDPRPDDGLSRPRR